MTAQQTLSIGLIDAIDVDVVAVAQASVLRHVFFVERGAISGDAYRKVELPPIDAIVVVGGGNMRACIANALVLTGIKVTIPRRLDRGKRCIFELSVLRPRTSF